MNSFYYLRIKYYVSILFPFGENDMFKNRSHRVRFSLFSIFITLAFTLPIAVYAQQEDAATLKIRAKALMEKQQLTEALPLYEKLALLTPNDADVHTNLGFSLLGKAANTEDPLERRQFRARARKAFVRADELDGSSMMIKGLIEGIPVDGADPEGFSDNAEANRQMTKGEAAFTSGRLDDALSCYESALKIDPRCYYAAVFSGDVYVQKGNFAAAENWYQKAIKIDPLVETAYRYSATPLMKQGKFELARDRYVEAFITAPYDKLAVNGIIQWAEATKAGLGHPKIDVPKITIGPDGKANSTLNINPLVDDGSLAWSSYVATRELWRKGKFAATFPKETAYRHSVMEEADALRSVVSSANAFKPKKLNEQIALLAKLDKEGLLEAFILMAIPDAGIASDHRKYLIENRVKLRQYVLNYVIH